MINATVGKIVKYFTNVSRYDIPKKNKLSSELSSAVTKRLPFLPEGGTVNDEIDTHSNKSRLYDVRMSPDYTYTQPFMQNYLAHLAQPSRNG